jgi:hypothetical protein
MNSKLLPVVTYTLLLSGIVTQHANAAERSSCNRDCLLKVLNQFEARMLKHDPKGIALTGNFRGTENYRPRPLGEGYWTRVTQIFDQLQLADPVNGQVAAVGLLDDGGRDAYFVLRLKVEAGRKISQSEMLLTHDGDAMFVQKDRSIKLDRTYLQPVPKTQRATRAELVKITEGFVDAWQYKDEDLMSVSADCAFLENNVRLQQPGVSTCGDMLEAGGKRGVPGAGKASTRGDPNRPMRAARPADPSIGRPALQGSQPWMRDRRYPLVDEERGVVLSYHIMGGEPARPGETVVYERATPFTTSSLSAPRTAARKAESQAAQPAAQPATQPAAQSTVQPAAAPLGGAEAAYMAGLFKIIDGKLVRIDHFEWEGGPNASGGFSDGPKF